MTMTDDECEKKEIAFHNEMVDKALEISADGHIPAYVMVTRGALNGRIMMTGNIHGHHFYEQVLQEALEYLRQNPDLGDGVDQCGHGAACGKCGVSNCPNFWGHTP